MTIKKVERMLRCHQMNYDGGSGHFRRIIDARLNLAIDAAP